MPKFFCALFLLKEKVSSMVATAERVGKVARIGGGVWLIRAMPELKRFFFCFAVFPNIPSIPRFLDVWQRGNFPHVFPFFLTVSLMPVQYFVCSQFASQCGTEPPACRPPWPGSPPSCPACAASTAPSSHQNVCSLLFHWSLPKKASSVSPLRLFSESFLL